VSNFQNLYPGGRRWRRWREKCEFICSAVVCLGFLLVEAKGKKPEDTVILIYNKSTEDLE